MQNYALMYRLGMTPWEGYGTAAAASIAAMLDLGCGRGQYTPELARRGWETTGVDVVPAAIEAARTKAPDGVSYVIGDATDLDATTLGTFDLFFDVGCFQGFGGRQRRAVGSSVRRLANPGATVLMLAFGPTRLRSLVGGVSQHEVEEAFEGWTLLSVDPAPTEGLGWPMSRTSPRWYRLRLAEA